jgi:hypothetical protein
MYLMFHCKLLTNPSIIIHHWFINHLNNISHWRLLWSLPLPARVFQHWWRLIHQAISIRPLLHAWYPNDHLSALFLLCGQVTGTYYHFAVGCPLKKSLLSLALSTLSLDRIFPYVDEIWKALTFYSPNISNDLGYLPTAFTSDHLVAIGTVFFCNLVHELCMLDEPKWSLDSIQCRGTCF